MVVQKTINNLKERPKDEKTAVATGGAVLVVIVLLFGWGLWFVQNIKKGGSFNTYIGDKPQDRFVAPAVRDAEKSLEGTMRSDSDMLRELRDAGVDVPTQFNSTGGEGDPFNTPAPLESF